MGGVTKLSNRNSVSLDFAGKQDGIGLRQRTGTGAFDRAIGET